MTGARGRIKLAHEMHILVRHRPVGAGARKQVTNWMNSGGHVARRRTELDFRETTGRRRAGRPEKPPWIGSAVTGFTVAGLAATGLAVLMLSLAAYPGHARDSDGRYAGSPLKEWFDGLKSGKGPCCSDADGTAVSDVDWESGNGHYRVRIEGDWVDVPDEAVITEPNRIGRTMVWPIRGYGGLTIRCFMPGSMT
jgi:hypothetical protein